MVQLENPGNFRPASESQLPSKPPVKLEIEDPLDEEHGPISKRSKISAPLQQKWSTGTSSFSSQPVHYNPLDEPSPLGLRLRKSPSLLDLIQMKLSQANTTTVAGANNEIGKKNLKCSGVTATMDKLKASNFPATLLRIGTWERVSRYEGDLVAKCYFAKHKLVWEVLDGGLKSKIEIQWSDITALKATCPENGPGTLDIVLSRQPLFFRETNPQPRKHTLWQATSDFTDGQASIHKRHFLQCPQGLLSKHFEKLMQCDPRLNLLSQKPDIVLDDPFFESRSSVFEGLDEPNCHGFDQLKSDFVSTFPGFHDDASSCAAQSPSSPSEILEPVARVSEAMYRGSPSPSSVMDTCAIEEIVSSIKEESREQSRQAQVKGQTLVQSMSVSDLLSHIEHCISEQMTPGKLPESREMMEELTHYLLSDSQFSSASDEQSLMSRVNSLCCLLQKDTDTAHVKSEDAVVRHVHSMNNQPNSIPESSTCKDKVMGGSAEGDCTDVLNCKAPPIMSRKDSFSELLLSLPRIASLPQFLFNIAEDDDNQAR
ncbi:hypothetical protein MRB53_009017 [Persea americana]|uniref:Uncharacterized protein n=1 Tax=Persea americana TaxID=3435 RepID=A0ACC2LN10_PERAE|nr:hypothetical protein MRB53_009017 [Persea americana]